MIDKMKKSGITEKRKILKELDKRQSELNKQKEEYAPDKLLAIREATKGRHVFINSLRTDGVILSVNEKAGRCKVMVHGKEVLIPLSGLSEPMDDVVDHKRRGTLQGALTESDVHVPDKINVIGQRVDPALSMIERYLNDASLAGLKQVKIIHGTGTGILAAAIGDFLMEHPLVEEFRKGHSDEGSDGVTIVKL